MAINDYNSLKTAIQTWMDRTDIAGNVDDMISLAEAGLNRELNVVETDTTLTGTAYSRSIDVSALSIVEPIVLKIVDTDGDEKDMVHQPDGSFNYLDNAGFPTFWAIDGTKIDMDRPLDQAYSFRFRYRGRFSLSESAPTNDLLTNHPDVYMAACITWGGLFIQDDAKVAKWGALLTSFVDSTKHTLSKENRGKMAVDPMLQFIGRNAWVNRSQ